MAQKSRIDLDLNETDLAAFRQLLAGGRLTIDALLEWLQTRGYDISRSSVGRYSKNFEAAAEGLRETRLLTEALVKELGEDASQGRQGRMLVEMIQSLFIKFVMKLRAEHTEIDTKDFMQMCKGAADLGRALRLNQDFEAEIRAEERKRLEAAVSQVEVEANGGGERMTPEEALAKVRAIYRGE